MVSKSQLLEILPPFTNSSLLIHDDQDVPSIMREVVDAHIHFTADYDEIFHFFNRPTVYDTCKALFDFCKENIKYVIESEESQTTKSPSALLAMGYGDCKHYAGFIAGVLSAIQRNTGKKIKWAYRFASYSIFSNDPGHVFVVVNDHGNEIWIDPVLNKFDERQPQPTNYIDKKVNDMLYRVSGVGLLELDEEMIPEVDIVPDFNTALDEEDGNLSPALLEAIQLLLYYNVIDTEGNINDQALLILEGGMPSEEYKRLVYARQELNVAAVNGFFSSIWRGVKKATLAIPRSAYLSLVALNIFGTATRLKAATVDQQGVDKVRGVWYSLGGDWQALENAIRNGAKKKRIFGIGAAAAVLPAWVLTATAIIAAITPVITSILKQKQQAGTLDSTFDPSLIDPDYKLPGESNSIMDFVKQNAIWLGLGGIAVWYYIKNRRA